SPYRPRTRPARPIVSEGESSMTCARNKTPSGTIAKTGGTRSQKRYRLVKLVSVILTPSGIATIVKRRRRAPMKASDPRPEERRRYGRIELDDEPFSAMLDGVPVQVVELSVVGFRIAHESRFPPAVGHR